MANEQVSLVPRELRNYGFPIARFLSQEEQARYEDACKSFSGKAKRTLDVNSNLWKVLLLNQIGIKTASLNELELALENGLGLQGHYEDAPAVVLRSAGDSYKPNDSLAKELVSKLKLKDFKTPKVITGLEIVADENSPYGLRFRTTDKTQITNAPDLKNENHQRRFTKINPDYSIEFNDKGNRTLWTRPEGLSRLYLGGGAWT